MLIFVWTVPLREHMHKDNLLFFCSWFWQSEPADNEVRSHSGKHKENVPPVSPDVVRTDNMKYSHWTDLFAFVNIVYIHIFCLHNHLSNNLPHISLCFWLNLFGFSTWLQSSSCFSWCSQFLSVLPSSNVSGTASLQGLVLSVGLWIQHYEKSQFRREWWVSCIQIMGALSTCY